MILTCPQCETHFEIDASLIGADGKKVRCSQCAHIWFHEPEATSPQEDSIQKPSEEPTLSPVDAPDSSESKDQRDEKNTDSIDTPNISFDMQDDTSIHYNQASDNDDEISVNIHRQALEEKTASKISLPVSGGAGKRNKSVSTLLLSSVMTLLAFVTISLLLQPFVTNKWPFMRSYYSAIGAQSALTVNTITINALKAELKEGITDIEITAKLVNTANSTSKLLPVLAEQLDSDGHTLERWVIMPDKSELEAHETLTLKAHYLLNDKADSVKLGFTETLSNAATLSDDAQVITLSASPLNDTGSD